MAKKITSIINDLSHVLLGEKEPLNIDKSGLDNSVLLEKAKQEWQAAFSFLIMSLRKIKLIAIYRLNAGKELHGYILQQVRKNTGNRTVKKRCKDDFQS